MLLARILPKHSRAPIKDLSRVMHRSYAAGAPGSGAGRGGGGGGAIKDSGGSLGQYATAQEESYFFNKQRELLEKMKKQMKDTPKSPEVTRKEPGTK